MLALAASMLPDAELIDHDIRELNELEGGGDATGSIDDNDPEVQAIVREAIAQHEQRWLDESIPALRGMTPRQAADDPIGRTELVRLLDSFPQTDRPDEMGAVRLRAALGL